MASVVRAAAAVPQPTLAQKLNDIFGLLENGRFGTETAVRSWIYGVVLSKLAVEIHRRLLSRLGKKAKEDEGESKEVVSKHGTSFTLMAGKPADLSWLSALPSYIVPVAFLIEGLRVLVYGKKGFTRVPIERGVRLLFGIFVMMPFFECFAEHDWSNPSGAQLREGYQRDHRFRGSLQLWAAVELLLTVSFSRVALDPRRRGSAAQTAGMALTLGLLNGGLGITVAHELLHKPRVVDKALAHMLLTNVCYLHWADEHLVGHHTNVATPKDPATARRGESLYAFLPRTVIGSFASAWGLYANRVREAGGVPLKTLFALKTFGPPLAWVAVLSRIIGCRVRQLLPLWAAQAVIGFGLLEAVNYIEHYGLLRAQLPDGSYEPVNPRHSWNSAHHLSNAILFKLQRHSDHHTFPQRPFQLLRNFEESPQLPTGYFGMVLLSCCPPAFFWIMNPLVDAHNSNGDTKLAEKEATQKFRRWCMFVFIGSTLGPLVLKKALQR